MTYMIAQDNYHAGKYCYREMRLTTSGRGKYAQCTHTHYWTPQLLAEVSIKQCDTDYAFAKKEDIMSKNRYRGLCPCTYAPTQHTPLHSAHPALHSTHHCTQHTQHYTYIHTTHAFTLCTSIEAGALSQFHMPIYIPLVIGKCERRTLAQQIFSYMCVYTIKHTQADHTPHTTS